MTLDELLTEVNRLPKDILLPGTKKSRDAEMTLIEQILPVATLKAIKDKGFSVKRGCVRRGGKKQGEQVEVQIFISCPIKNLRICVFKHRKVATVKVNNKKVVGVATVNGLREHIYSLVQGM